MIIEENATKKDIEEFKKESAVYFFTMLGKEKSLAWKEKREYMINHDRRENIKKSFPIWKRTIEIINELYL